MTARQLRKDPSKRNGVTLIELLVVITILLMITAVTIPVISPAVQQRRVREAARLTSSYIAAARARAMETGRPVGVMIERFTPGLASATSTGVPLGAKQTYSMNLSLAESPPPYAGDFINSTVTVNVPVLGANYLQVTALPQGDIWSDQQISNGDRIRLNYQGTYYTVYSGSYDSVGHITGFPWNLYPLNPTSGMTPANATVVFPPIMQPGSSVNLPFEIFRQPIRSAVDPLQLPEGIVIDLNVSGMSTDSRTTSSVTTTGVFSSLATTTSNPVISFSPSGAVDMLYDNGATRATGPIFLLLGRSEKISTNVWSQGAGTPELNLIDPDSLWVAISQQTGQVTVTENYVNVVNNLGVVTGTISGTLQTDLVTARTLASFSVPTNGAAVVTTLGGR
jgi:prepilin-type N-terminal cleavage/methylation domain-containing protein